MANVTPYFRLTARGTGRELHDLVLDVKIEESVSKLDMLTLTLYDVNFELVDSEELAEGAEVEYIFGWLGGDSSTRANR